jgi:hypothetical protein
MRAPALVQGLGPPACPVALRERERERGREPACPVALRLLKSVERACLAVLLLEGMSRCRGEREREREREREELCVGGRVSEIERARVFTRAGWAARGHAMDGSGLGARPNHRMAW